MDSKGPKEKSTAVLMDGLGNFHHPVSTKNKLAQKFFDQGFIMIYAFNHNEAIRSFQKAAELDPELAMAYWGIAFALGPNYNLPADDAQRKLAYKSIRKALKHSYHATEKEQDYINALAKRYSKDLKKDQSILNAEFRKAMKELYKKYQDDQDAATLYAESMMILKPWQLWSNDGTPAEGTTEIVEVLESVLKKNPNHPGANHYYIHAVEASQDPGRALNSAKVLKTLVPAAGHLVHMPAHTLFRVGDYEGTSSANIQAITADEKYIEEHKPQGIYPIMYYNHNINFLSVSKMMEGNFAEAIKYAKQIEKNVSPMVKEMQMLEIFNLNPFMILISFDKWNDILNYPEPDSSLALSRAVWHFGRGLAFVNTGKSDEAKNELAQMQQDRIKIPETAYFGYNTGETIFELSQNILKGNIAFRDSMYSEAISYLKRAVILEDILNYNEPPDWYPSVRLNLAKLLFDMEEYIEAEQIFREELKKYPHNGRGLYGLCQSLKAQGKNKEAEEVLIKFKEAWKNADTDLSFE